MDYLLHFGYLLYLISYSVRDILWLRIITIIASSSLIVYGILSGKTSHAALAWISLFALINTIHSIILLVERRPVKMSEEQAELYETIFHTLKPRDFLKFLHVANWKDVDADDVIIQEGSAVGGVVLITSGHARIDVKGRHVAETTKGKFVGEMSYLTNALASADVVATEATRYLFWPTQRLNEFFSTHADLDAAFVGILGVDLVSKVKERHAKVEKEDS